MKASRTLPAAALCTLLAVGSGGLAAAAAPHPAVVYTETNATTAGGGNRVLAFRAGSGGALAPAGSYATGGEGSGAGLGSQGALAVTPDGRYLVAVNAGSATVAAFAIRSDGTLRLLGSVGAGGSDPVSVALGGGMAYVLDAGDNVVAAFRLDAQGLHPDGQRALPAGTSGAAEVALSPAGDRLLVTAKGSNTLDSLKLLEGGGLGAVSAQASTGSVPYGFAFTREGVAVVSDAGDGALTTYAPAGEGSLHPVSEVTDGLLAACWVAVSRSGVAYTTDAHSGAISSYRVGGDGRLTLLRAVAGATGGTPLDLVFGPGQRWLYVLNAGSQTIQSSEVLGHGLLSTPNPVAVIPPTATGLAVAQ